MPPPNRGEPEAARRVVEHLLANPAERKKVLGLLCEGIKRANELGGSCWSVTLDHDLVRLNIGKVEVFALQPGWVRFVVDRASAPSSFDLDLMPSEYASLPTAVRFERGPNEIAALIDQIRAPWLTAVQGATGTAPRSRYRKSHSPGVLVYLKAAIDANVPNPLGAA